MEYEEHNRKDNLSPELPTGNDNERLIVTTGQILAIDQFMLSNRQFLARLTGVTERFSDTVNDFGGCILNVSPGTYRVYRDPMRVVVLFYKSELQGEEQKQHEEALTETVIMRCRRDNEQGRVLVDTRCFVCADVGILSDSSLLSRYERLRKERQDKAGRDLLRERGAAVRYGFRRLGDDLRAFVFEKDGCFVLLPAK